MKTYENSELDIPLDFNSLLIPLYKIIETLKRLNVDVSIFYESVYLASIDNLRFKNEIGEIFRNGIPNEYEDFKIHNSQNSNFLINKLKLERAFDLSFIGIFNEQLRTNSSGLKQIEPFVLNLLKNYVHLYKPNFIENYQKSFLNTLTFKQSTKGLIFYDHINFENVQKTIELFQSIISMDKKTINDLVKAIANIYEDVNRFYNANYNNKLALLMESIEFDTKTTKQLRADVAYIILDKVGYANLRGINEFEDAKSYGNYRLKKLSGILSQQNKNRQLFF